MAEWFYGKDNTQHGPVSDLEIRNLVNSGQITMETIVWREGMTDWVPLKDIPEFNSSAGSHPSSASPYVSPQTNAAQAPYASSIPTDGMSVAALVLGILALISCWVGGVFGIPAVIYGGEQQYVARLFASIHPSIGVRSLAITAEITRS